MTSQPQPGSQADPQAGQQPGPKLPPKPLSRLLKELHKPAVVVQRKPSIAKLYLPIDVPAIAKLTDIVKLIANIFADTKELLGGDTDEGSFGNIKDELSDNFSEITRSVKESRSDLKNCLVKMIPQCKNELKDL